MTDDIVLITQSEKKLQNTFKLCLYMDQQKTKRSFSINKYCTMIIKPMNYELYITYLFIWIQHFYLVHIILVFPFTDDFLMSHIIKYQYLYSKIKKFLFFLWLTFSQINIFQLFWKRKKKIPQSYVISKAIYFSPLLDSNKIRTRRIQSLINTGLYWVYWFFQSWKQINNSNSTIDKLSLNSTMTIYAISKDLDKIPSICGNVYAALQVKCFCKWVKKFFKWIIRKTHKIYSNNVSLLMNLNQHRIIQILKWRTILNI